jgi:DNA-binding transcriptional LysR family regulator
MNATLQRLRYFVAVADELSFTRAAERLHVSQPSLSAQVRALERGLGLELLHRTTRRVELTEAGRVLHEDVRRILDDLDQAHARARRAQDATSANLRVAYTASVGYQALPLILDELEARAPELTVSAYRSWSTRVLEAVRAGDVDLGLVREFEGARDLVGETLRMEPLAVFASVRHPLAERSTVTIRDLEGATMVVVPASLAPGFHDLVLALCVRRGFDPPVIELSAPDNREPLLAHLSRHADRVFVGPVSMSTTSWEGVVHVPIEDPDARMGLSIVWPATGASPAVTAAVAAARAVSEREGWLMSR